MKSKLLKILLTSIAFVVVTNRADEIIDWNQHLLESALTAKSSPLLTTRIGAIVQAAVFDAVNGIERKYEPIPCCAECGCRRFAARCGGSSCLHCARWIVSSAKDRFGCQTGSFTEWHCVRQRS